MKLMNYALGHWVKPTDNLKSLHDASSGEVIAQASSSQLDFEAMMKYAREKGNPVLRKMTFRQRGLMLKKLALFLFNRRKSYYPISYQTGATKRDSWIDIEGGIGNLFANASLRRKMGDQEYFVDGDMVSLSKGGSFVGHHIMVPKRGVALHINAFNFPIWGMLEKCAVNWLAGMPAIVKPATLTSYLTEAMVKDIIKSEILPEGALQLICGSANGILDYVKMGDVVTFTGSASTGQYLKAHPKLISEAVPFNLEADSLNCTVLGTDVNIKSPEFELFINEIYREMTVKCGQKCTAIRRIIVPQKMVNPVSDALSTKFEKLTIGDPRDENTIMGPLAGITQLEEVMERVKKLSETAEIVYGHPSPAKEISQNGAFIRPVLLVANEVNPDSNFNHIEAFGPVSTIVGYSDLDEAIHISQQGKGSLVSSICTFDDEIAKNYTINAASHHGRILVLNRDCAKESTGHGSPMPLLVHGGPGRAGGGEEMGGLRGVKHYLQRCAVQGSPTSMTHILQQFQEGADYKIGQTHVFKKHFEDLEIGETVITHKRTITEADITNFANVSWDHFYAHTDITALDETIFEERVAHGYFILSAAAGLFVNPDKGPVLLNYGLENCRFLKPVYAGATIGVRLTVKEKIAQEKKEENDIKKGIVKFLVDVYDEADETVAIATILTMVKMKNQ